METHALPESSDARLMGLVQGNNIPAMKAICLQFAPDLYHDIHRHTQSDAASMHILERVMLLFWEKSHTYSQNVSIKGILTELADKYLPRQTVAPDTEYSEPETEIDVDALWEKIEKKIASHPAAAPKTIHPLSRISKLANRVLPRRSFRPTYLSLLVVLFALMVIHIMQSSMLSRTTHTITTGAGEERELQFPDGSTARLAAQSQLTYQRKFSDSLRVIFLKGKISVVTHLNDSRPFAVVTPDAAVTAFGPDSCSFTVWTSGDTTFVSAQRGIVALCRVDNLQNSEIYVRPGMTRSTPAPDPNTWPPSPSQPLSERRVYQAP